MSLLILNGSIEEVQKNPLKIIPMGYISIDKNREKSDFVYQFLEKN